jgi:hypothetical protein
MLSDLQRQILVLCLERNFIPVQDILAQIWGWQPAAWGSRKASIGKREYARGHASLSRSITRLWASGNLIIWKNLTGPGTGVTLTEAGEALAHTIMAERKTGKVTG